ncbi:MAG: YfhO family protein [Chloroflexota bacterium]|nr:YfhO family protein [Chloroflexota bacterium]
MIAFVALLAGILFSARNLLLEPIRAGLDAVIFFWPMYAFLGDQLRAGNIPGWNPHQFAGAPFAADPESGWMYLPAMMVFGLLPLGAAIRLYMTLHLLLAGIGTFALGRMLGMTSAGALTAGWGFSFSGLMSDRTRCCYLHVQVATWIPWALIGIELALRARNHRVRVGGWLLAGVAISQMLGGWLGQGAYYGLLVVASYVCYRVFTPVPWTLYAAVRRLPRLLLHGVVPLVIGLGLAAPGILPRLAYEDRSNLAHGYAGVAGFAADLGGWTATSQIAALLSPSGWYIGVSVAALACISLIVAGRRFAVPYFASLTVVTFILGLEAITPLHRLFALLPRFQEIHDHIPERIALALALGPAMLAGAAVSTVAPMARQPMNGRRTAMNAVSRPQELRRSRTLLSLRSARRTARGDRLFTLTRKILPAALALFVAVDLTTAAASRLSNPAFARVDIAAITEPNATARQLSGEGELLAPRFFGFDPSLQFTLHDQQTYYRHLFQNPLTAWLLVNNQATLWSLADVQGYNPLQLGRYTSFLTALNGMPQEYHGAYVLPSGLGSPLLPLLGSEYIVVPRQIDPGKPALLHLASALPEVWRDDRVRILHFEPALPRAWIVHEAITRSEAETLPLMASGAVDFSRTVVLNETLPSSAPAEPAATATSDATITAYEPDALTVETTTSAAGILVLSEVYDDGWQATVDEESVPLMVANHAFRAVPIPAGNHIVRLTYTPPGLVPGLSILVLTVVTLIVAGALAIWRDRERSLAVSNVRNTYPLQ